MSDKFTLPCDATEREIQMFRDAERRIRIVKKQKREIEKLPKDKINFETLVKIMRIVEESEK